MCQSAAADERSWCGDADAPMVLAGATAGGPPPAPSETATLARRAADPVADARGDLDKTNRVRPASLVGKVRAMPVVPRGAAASGTPPAGRETVAQACAVSSHAPDARSDFDQNNPPASSKDSEKVTRRHTQQHTGPGRFRKTSQAPDGGPTGPCWKRGSKFRQDKANDAIQHDVDRQQDIDSCEQLPGGTCRFGYQGAIDTSIVRMNGEHPVQRLTHLDAAAAQAGADAVAIAPAGRPPLVRGAVSVHRGHAAARLTLSAGHGAGRGRSVAGHRRALSLRSRPAGVPWSRSCR